MNKFNHKQATQIARIVLVDDHPIVRRGLALMINEDPNLEVCGEAAGICEALRLINELNPDLVVIDISLKDGSGIELIKQIKAQNPSIKMLVSSMHEETLFSDRALHAGAKGYINKQETSDKIVDAIPAILAGKIYLSDNMTERMLHRAVYPEQTPVQSPVDSLTDRELEVFTLIGQGMSTRKIETHREHIKRKLNLESSHELIHRAVQWAMEQK
jgi:DNA-binding NarL/FixJ family response regulator